MQATVWTLIVLPYLRPTVSKIRITGLEQRLNTGHVLVTAKGSTFKPGRGWEVVLTGCSLRGYYHLRVYYHCVYMTTS